MRKNKKKQNDELVRFELLKIQICPFVSINDLNRKFVRPLRNDGYPYVICVLDKKNNIVIDLDMLLKYDYIDVHYSFRAGFEGKFKEGYRYAICPINLDKQEKTDAVIEKAKYVVDCLCEEKDVFDNGNIVLSNQEYKNELEVISNQKKENENNEVKGFSLTK